MQTSAPRTALTAAVILAASAAPAAADLQYLTQSRWIGASAGQTSGAPDPYPILATAPDFAPFDDAVQHEVEIPGTPSAYHNRGYATQNSVLSPTHISWSGEVGGTDEYPFVGQGHGLGRSVLDVTFTVTESTPYNLSGFIDQDDAGAGSLGFVRLSALGGAVLFLRASVGGPLPSIDLFETSGTLAAGDYRLELIAVNGRIGPDTGTDTSAYSTTLTIPSPAAAILAPLALAFTRRRAR
jgi:hypothetical protein